MRATGRLLALFLLTLLATYPARGSEPVLSDAHIAKLLQHGPWPAKWAPDPSNRVSGKPDAITLGRDLFFTPKLSGNGKMSCATCHHPGRGWTDRLPQGLGTAKLDRNTQSLFNVRLNRWFGWDGQNDNLWAQSIRPLLDAKEMDASTAHVVNVVSDNPELSKAYETVFGVPPDTRDLELTLVNIGKAMAAFQETIVSGRTPFDVFRDALGRGDETAAMAYPIEAKRGASLFFGRGNCTFCHTGPNFTNGEFQDAGVPYFLGPGRVDKGRYEGIGKLKASRFTLEGDYTDDPAKTGSWKVRGVRALHRNFGEFKVPSLRNLTQTAPYMHNGSLATIEDVVRHYSEIDVERLHADGTRVLAPLHLNEREIQDLVAFLESLSVN
ncbi:MAG: cytochrome c peroxidase [Pseudomonadota bacterium]